MSTTPTAAHIVASFDDELKMLSSLVVAMGALCQQQLGASVIALLSKDAQTAQSVISMDSEIDALLRQVEDKAISIIARRQPMAVDLRQIMSAIRIALGLERVGDMAKNIAKRSLKMEAGYTDLPFLSKLKDLADIVGLQLGKVMTAYSERDAQKAIDVWRQDEEVDRQHSALLREIMDVMTKDQKWINHGTHLLFCTKNIERIGDHATNIAENVHYFVIGEHLPEDRPRA